MVTILESGTGIQGTAHTPSSQESRAPLGFTPFLLSPQSLTGGAFARMMDSASPWPPCLQPLSSLGLPRRLLRHRPGELTVCQAVLRHGQPPFPHIRCRRCITTIHG